MSVPNPPPVGTAPSPAPTTQDTENFDARADAFHQFFPNWLNNLFPAVLDWIRLRASEVQLNSNAAVSASIAATAAANNPAVKNAAANAAAAQASAAQAQVFASQAQATNPDSPIRINPTRVRENFALPSGYNGSSDGPITIDDGVTVTVSHGANWSIH